MNYSTLRKFISRHAYHWIILNIYYAGLKIRTLSKDLQWIRRTMWTSQSTTPARHWIQAIKIIIFDSGHHSPCPGKALSSFHPEERRSIPPKLECAWSFENYKLGWGCLQNYSNNRSSILQFCMVRILVPYLISMNCRRNLA